MIPEHTSLEVKGRVIVVGDVHGCVDELETLYHQLDHRPDDTWIFAGDLVAKGPHSKEAVAFARQHKMLGVLGNHDARWLKYWQTLNPKVLASHHRSHAHRLAPEDWDYIGTLPLSIRIPSLNLLIVHAGVVPQKSLLEQKREDILNIRSVRADGSISFRAIDGEPWAAQWSGPDHIVFGHDAVRGLQRHPHATGLDTGCVYGKSLTAIIFPHRELVSVPAKKMYRVP